MIENLLPLITFAFSMSITPGPNNIMLTASGANFGFKRTIPHIAGIITGMLLLFILSAAGLGVLFYSFPLLQTIMKILSALYLIYLSLKIILLKRTKKYETNQRPLNIYQAMAFQFLNPKALMMSITAIATFTEKGDNYIFSSAIMIIVFLLICLPSIATWAGVGILISRFLENDYIFRGFNILMGLLLIGSLGLIL
ncbi:MAG: LysE family translocator [Desulfobacula sp.]|nr:LysE family translocator [Desulfobacula sp.]